MFDKAALAAINAARARRGLPALRMPRDRRLRDWLETILIVLAIAALLLIA
jgi:hypothetical protein